MPYVYGDANIYRRGDYYRGDYYRGDFGSIFKKITGVVGKVAGAVLPGPAGAVVRAITSTSSIASRFGPAQLPAPPSQLPIPTPGAMGAVQRFLPGGATGMTTAPAGYHINKAYLRFVRAQQLGRNVQDPTSKPRVTNLVVRNRTPNPLNAKAFRRANKRVGKGVGILMNAIRGTGYSVKRTGLPRGSKRKSR